MGIQDVFLLKIEPNKNTLQLLAFKLHPIQLIKTKEGGWFMALHPRRSLWLLEKVYPVH